MITPVPATPATAVARAGVLDAISDRDTCHHAAGRLRTVALRARMGWTSRDPSRWDRGIRAAVATLSRDVAAALLYDLADRLTSGRQLETPEELAARLPDLWQPRVALSVVRGDPDGR